MNNILVFSKHISSKRSLVFTFPKHLSKIIWIILIATALLSLIFYLFQISSMLKAGFLLNDYEYELIKLNQQNRALEIELSRSVSLNNIEGLIEELNFEKIGSINHIKISENFITARKNFMIE